MHIHLLVVRKAPRQTCCRMRPEGGWCGMVSLLLLVDRKAPFLDLSHTPLRVRRRAAVGWSRLILLRLSFLDGKAPSSTRVPRTRWTFRLRRWTLGGVGDHAPSEHRWRFPCCRTIASGLSRHRTMHLLAERGWSGHWLHIHNKVVRKAPPQA